MNEFLEKRAALEAQKQARESVKKNKTRLDVQALKLRAINEVAALSNIKEAPVALRHISARYMTAIEAAEVLLGTSAENDAAIADALLNGFEKQRYEKELSKFKRAREKEASSLIKTIKSGNGLSDYSAMRAIELRDKIFAAEDREFAKAESALKSLRELAGGGKN